MEINALAGHHLGSMAEWERQGVWLALGKRVWDIQALLLPFSTSGGPRGKTVPPTEACLKSLCSELLVGLLQIHNK